MEEISDVEDNSIDPFIADAIANEGDLSLTEEQKRNFRKVCEWYFLPHSPFLFIKSSMLIALSPRYLLLP